eukprot:NODE_718_length_4500_cov_0.642127.p3 type:complete len:237 gc:universal NODE_718_length_4500_cov_0.642127:4498-3788(-)
MIECSPRMTSNWSYLKKDWTYVKSQFLTMDPNPQNGTDLCFLQYGDSKSIYCGSSEDNGDWTRFPVSFDIIQISIHGGLLCAANQNQINCLDLTSDIPDSSNVKWQSFNGNFLSISVFDKHIFMSNESGVFYINLSNSDHSSSDWTLLTSDLLFQTMSLYGSTICGIKYTSHSIKLQAGPYECFDWLKPQNQNYFKSEKSVYVTVSVSSNMIYTTTYDGDVMVHGYASNNIFENLE